MIVIIALIISIFYLFYKVTKNGPNIFTSTFSLSTILFVLTFYLPIIFLPQNYSWYQFSEMTQNYAVTSHVSLGLACLISNLFYLNYKNVRYENVAKEIDGRILFIFWSVGIFVYLLMYVIKGIPVFSGRVDYARQEFLSGNGFLLNPALIMINVAIVLSFIYRRNKAFLFYFVIGTSVVLLSGWRGNLLHLLVMLLAILSFNKKLKLAWLLYATVFVYFISLIGLWRAYNSGYAIYGLELNSVKDYMVNPFVYVILRLGIHADTFNIVVNYFDNKPMLGEAFLLDVNGIFFGSGRTIVYYLKDLFAEFESGGGFPPTMFGAFFMDFNIFGIICMTIIFVCIHNYLKMYFLSKIKQNLVYLYMYAVIISGFFTSFLGTFVKYYFSNLIFNSIMVFGLIIFTKILTGKIRISS